MKRPAGFARTFWFLRQLWMSARALVRLRGRIADRGLLVLTHEPDIDRDGQDVQMGAVVAELEQRAVPFFEVVLLPLDREAWRRRARLRASPFVSWVVPEVAARVLAIGRPAALESSRVRVMSWLLVWMRPRALVLVDEAGSGRALVAAARLRSIPSLGVQHGDFQPGNVQYDSDARRSAGRPPVEPVDLLCVWSPFFAERLVAISRTYPWEAVRVTGRARPPRGTIAPSRRERTGSGTRVLFLARPGAVAEFDALLAALARSVELRIRLHPTSPGEALSSGARLADQALAQELQAADVVLGSKTSASFEALWWRRPYLELDELAGPGIEECVATVVSLAQEGFQGEEERERVFGTGADTEENSARAIVDHALGLAGLTADDAQGKPA